MLLENAMISVSVLLLACFVTYAGQALGQCDLRQLTLPAVLHDAWAHCPNAPGPRRLRALRSCHLVAEAMPRMMRAFRNEYPSVRLMRHCRAGVHSLV